MLELVPVPRDPDAAPPTGLLRALRIVGGAFLVVLGLFLIVLFVISLVHELMTGTVFGLGICLLMIACGMLLTRDGVRLLTGFRIQFTKVE